jgi:hypothetical protein
VFGFVVSATTPRRNGRRVSVFMINDEMMVSKRREIWEVRYISKLGPAQKRSHRIVSTD